MSRLTDEQRRQFEDQGFLVFPALFSEDEIAPLRAAVETVAQRQGPEVVREPEGDAVRLVYGAHTFNDAFARLSRHPRWLEPAMELMGGPVYIHQSRLNPKAAHHGRHWAWHQDYATWADRDGLAEPRAFMVAILLDEANSANGPLMIVPGSHKRGLIHDAVDNAESPGYTLFHITEGRLAEVVEEGGIEPMIGPAGTVVISHCNIVHGSNDNITPWPRRIFYLNVASVDNPPTKFQRAEHHCARDWSPLEPLSDECLRATT
jgi:ectoine hydroxylase